MLEKEKICACYEHIDIALDEYIDRFNQAPEMSIKKDGVCIYCGQKSNYILYNLKSEKDPH